MNNKTLKSPLSVNQVPAGLSEFRVKLNLLEHLVAVGEEPHEIQSLVAEVADISSKLLFEQLGGAFEKENPVFVNIVIKAFFNWVFLVNLKRSARLAKVSQKSFESFILQFSRESDSPELVHHEMIYFLLTQLYILLGRTNKAVDSELRISQLGKCYRKFKQIPIGQFTMN